MLPPESNRYTASADVFRERFIGNDASSVSREDMLAFLARATMEVFAATQQVPVVAGYNNLPHLTQRQIEILEMLNVGKTPKQVREEFWIKEKTMETHMSRIHKALGTKGYCEAVKKARMIGILAYPGAE